MTKLFVFTLMTEVLMLVIVGCAPGSPVQILTPAPNATPAPGGQVTVPAMSIDIDAPGPNPLMNQPDARGETAGALVGLWHGIISPVTLLISFANPGVQMYEVHNDGSPYNLGFLFGFIVLLVAIGAVIRSRRV